MASWCVYEREKIIFVVFFLSVFWDLTMLVWGGGRCGSLVVWGGGWLCIWGGVDGLSRCRWLMVILI